MDSLDKSELAWVLVSLGCLVAVAALAVGCYCAWRSASSLRHRLFNIVAVIFFGAFFGTLLVGIIAGRINSSFAATLVGILGLVGIAGAVLIPVFILFFVVCLVLVLREKMRRRPRNQLRRLIDAIAKKDHRLIVTLLEDGLNPNVAEDDGITALHFAAGMGDPMALRLLLAHGAAINADATIGTPLDFAIATAPTNVNDTAILECIRILAVNGGKTRDFGEELDGWLKEGNKRLGTDWRGAQVKVKKPNTPNKRTKSV